MTKQLTFWNVSRCHRDSCDLMMGIKAIKLRNALPPTLIPYKSYSGYAAEYLGLYHNSSTTEGRVRQFCLTNQHTVIYDLCDYPNFVSSCQLLQISTIDTCIIHRLQSRGAKMWANAVFLKIILLYCNIILATRGSTYKQLVNHWSTGGQ